VLVGGGTAPMFPPNEIVLWNDDTETLLGRKCFERNVLRILLIHNRYDSFSLFLFSLSTYYLSNVLISRLFFV
jgi:hypothetical protein